jgi:hypothetical protein
MSKDDPIVYVLDDDYRVREALTSLLSSVGFRLRSSPPPQSILNQKVGLSRMFDIGSGAAGHERPGTSAGNCRR